MVYLEYNSSNEYPRIDTGFKGEGLDVGGVIRRVGESPQHSRQLVKREGARQRSSHSTVIGTATTTPPDSQEAAVSETKVSIGVLLVSGVPGLSTFS